MAGMLNTIFWVDVERIKPNPFQPRRDFSEDGLRDLAQSIRQYGVLQPLVVTRKENEREDGISVEYELIAGERRLRASKLAGVSQVPVVIRTEEGSDQMKLELAIIENLQREELNPIDRARAFEKLHKEFKYSHAEIAAKMGKSREYVSNSMRLLALPEDILQSLGERKITEGHTRPLLMLQDRPEEQKTLWKDIMLKRLSVRDAERISRQIAVERARRLPLDQELLTIEKELSEKLGTRVHIEKKEHGGRLLINFFANEDLHAILSRVKGELERAGQAEISPDSLSAEETLAAEDKPADEPDETELYSVTNFTV